MRSVPARPVRLIDGLVGATTLNHLVSPIILYAACGLGALGVALALPKRTFSPFIVGGIIAAIAFGLLMIGLGVATPADQRPNILFYVFAGIALLASLRVITHPRPIYAALYFVLTILASSGLYLLLTAEFMAFALIIVYAGAILITYLFVIMLATETPSADEMDTLNDYDRFAREPIAATIAGFVLLGALTTVLSTGAAKALPETRLATVNGQQISLLTRKVETVLRDTRDATGKPLLAAGETVASVEGGENGIIKIAGEAGSVTRTIPRAEWPADVTVENIEGVAFTLIGAHPGAIEIAGIILLMAMLGAVVLARKKVDIDEAATHEAMNVLGEKAPGAAQ